MSLINISNLTFAYEGSCDNVFENVSFCIDTNWKLGLTGRNGRGKTTLLNLLMEKYEYSGTIACDTCFEYFPYEVKNESGMVIDILKQIAPDAQDWMILRELNLLGVEGDALYRNYHTMSYGEKTKCLLAALFLKDNSFLLIDEPTNHLDMDGRKMLSRYLNNKSGFILVSHDRAFLDGCIDHIIAINAANIDVQKGNFSSWWKNKQNEDVKEKRANEKLKEDIGRLSEAMNRTKRWSDAVEKTKFGTKNSGSKVDRGYISHKSAKMMKRSKAIEGRKLDMIEEKSKLLKNIEANEDLKITPLLYHQDRLVELKNICLSYKDKVVLDSLSLSVNKGERIVICAKNGGGKSSLLKIILGQLRPTSGEIIKNDRLKISYVPQNAGFLKGSLQDFASHSLIDKTRFMTVLRKLGFTRDQFDKDMERYSDGQKKKVLIAKSLCESAHLYIWDEPLNYIDVISRIQIEELVKQSFLTLLFVEHDYSFYKEIATREICL